MAVYGYCRISRATQSIDRQIRNISEFDSSAKLYKEAFTGTTQDRPEWQKLRKKLKQGDTVIFDSVSRMSRNAEEGFAEYESLYNSGINLVFIKEPHINTETYKAAMTKSIPMTGTKVDLILNGVNAFLLELAKDQIRLAFDQAEKEVTDLHKRTAEGMQTAKNNGRQIGRRQGAEIVTKKSIEAKKLILKHSLDFGGSLTDKEVMQMIGGIARNTFYKYKRELKAEQK